MNKRKHIEINIGNACNMKCLFCMSIYGGAKLKADKKFIYQSILKNYKEGCNSIGFLGGEPTIFPELRDYIKLAKTLGYSQIQVTTNGILFRNFEKLKLYTELGLNNIKLSIHGHDDESDFTITRVPNSFSFKMQFIENFYKIQQEYNPNIRLDCQIVISKLNYQNLLYMAKLLLSKGVRSMKFQFIGYYTDYPEENLKQTLISYAMVLPYLRELKEFVDNDETAKRYIKIGDFPSCFLIKNKIVENPFDKFVGESYDYIDNVADGRKDSGFSFKERKKNQLKYYPLEQCKDCKLRYYNPCPGFYNKYFEFRDKLELDSNEEFGL